MIRLDLSYRWIDRLWVSTAARQKPPKARMIINANHGVEFPLGESPPVLVIAGVAVECGLQDAEAWATALSTTAVAHGSCDGVGVGV